MKIIQEPSHGIHAAPITGLACAGAFAQTTGTADIKTHLKKPALHVSGRYTEQQDALLFGMPRVFEAGAVEGQLERIFKDCAQALGGVPHAGTTAACVYVQPMPDGALALTTAHVGDSRCALIEVRFRRAFYTSLTRDHHPERHREALEALGGFVERGRAYGQLAMAQCFGHAQFPAVTAQPDIHTHIISKDTLARTRALYLAVHTDGIYAASFDDKAGVEIAPFPPKPSQDMAKTAAGAMAQQLLDYGPYSPPDNASLILFDLKKRAASTPFFAAVFDGNGRNGAALMSERAAMIFAQALKP